MFGPQKGATREDVLLLDAALERFAAVLERDLPGCPAGLGRAARRAARPAASARRCSRSAAGCESGIGLVRELTGLDAALDAADLVITGEGSFDHQSLRGKVVAGVAGAARDRGVPCVVLAGRVSAGRREAAAAGVTETYSLVEHFGGEERGGRDAALSRPAEGLRALGRPAGRGSGAAEPSDARCLPAHGADLRRGSTPRGVSRPRRRTIGLRTTIGNHWPARSVGQ